MSAHFKESETFSRCRATLDDLLADDMIQSMMHADGVSSSFMRTLFFEVGEKRKAWGVHPVSPGVSFHDRELAQRPPACS